MQRIVEFTDRAIRTWAVRFLLSGLIMIGPFVLQPDLFDAGIGRRDLWLFVFWFGALLGLSTYVRIRSLSNNWKAFSSITVGFASVFFFQTLPSLVEYPTLTIIYVASFVSPLIFSSIASGIGIAIGAIVRRRIGVRSHDF
jgi:hypothetical protein